LEDVMEELNASMRRQPADQARDRPSEVVLWDSQIRLLLGLIEFDHNVPKSKRPDLSLDYLYAGLGATQDFTTPLLSYAFRRQTQWDPANAPYYYDCLNAISSKSKSDELNMELAMLASEGYVSRYEIKEAYNYLGFDYGKLSKLTDQDILGQFEVRLDNQPKHEAMLREKLKIIGRARGSSLLTNAVDNGASFSFFIHIIY